VNTPPVARRTPVERSLFGETVIDDYGWLRNREDPETLAHLAAENAYAESLLAPLASVRQAIFDEIVARTQQTDISAPARWGEWWYATRTEEGKQYPVYVRMRGGPDGPEQVLLDANEVAAGKDYLSIGVFKVSPDQRWLAYSVDIDGSESFL
jgi:oligopeptidase B